MDDVSRKRLGAVERDGLWLWKRHDALCGGIFMWIIFLVVIVILVYFILHVTKSRPPGKENPMDVLKRRYARGEITKEEFVRIKKDLEA